MESGKGEPRPGETQVSNVTSASITGDQIYREGIRGGVMENSLECDLNLKPCQDRAALEGF